jgi:hypothetical protein
MDYIEDFGRFNTKNKLDAKTYVDNNYYVLKQVMNIDEGDYDSIDDIKDVLIEYFTRFPDQISSVSLNTFGVAKNYVPRLNNIGGTIKYR